MGSRCALSVSSSVCNPDTAPATVNWLSRFLGHCVVFVMKHVITSAIWEGETMESCNQSYSGSPMSPDTCLITVFYGVAEGFTGR